VLLQSNSVVTLLVNSRGWCSVHVLLLPDEKRYGNRLHWCKYIRDINGATQRLKATVPDRRVWLPAPAYVIVAVPLNKALKNAHGALKWAKQSPRPCGPLLLKIAPREMKHALKMHVPVCLHVLYRIRVLWLPCTVLYDISINAAYKTLSKYFTQVLSFVTSVHITQTASRLVQITHCIQETNFKISLP